MTPSWICLFGFAAEKHSRFTVRWKGDKTLPYSKKRNEF